MQIGYEKMSYLYNTRRTNCLNLATEAKQAAATLSVAVTASDSPVAERYDPDSPPGLMYLSGLSGGGKMASMTASEHANLFKGAIFNCGVEFWDRATPQHIDLIRQNHYVFVTGTLDQALEPTRKVHARYLDAGVVNSKLMVIRDMTHRNPNRYVFAEAVAYLDARLQDAQE